MSKLFVIEWDGWCFSGVCKTREVAESNIEHYLENIREIDVKGNIKNNTVFLVSDHTWDYINIHNCLEDAEEYLNNYEGVDKNKLFIKEIKVIT